MKKPNCILVPVDYSETSLAALDFGILIAGQFDSQLVVLTVQQPSPAEPYAVLDFDLQTATEKLKEIFKERQAKAAKGLSLPTENKLRILAREGAAVDEILKAAMETQADIIVMGTHGRKGLARAILGSVTEEMVRRAPCPVLAVRAGMPLPKEELTASAGGPVEAKRNILRRKLVSVRDKNKGEKK